MKLTPSNIIKGICPLCLRYATLYKVWGVTGEDVPGYYCNDCIQKSIMQYFQLLNCDGCRALATELHLYTADGPSDKRKAYCFECLINRQMNETDRATSEKIKNNAKKAINFINGLGKEVESNEVNRGREKRTGAGSKKRIPGKDPKRDAGPSDK